MAQVIEGQLILPAGVCHGQVVIDGDTIAAVLTDASRFHTPTRLVDEGHLVSPGFIDIQINGAFGREFKTDDDALDVISAAILRYGVTALCPTITTADLTTYATRPQALLARCGPGPRARFLGFHFEGPVFNPKKVGAHNPSLLRVPKDMDLDVLSPRLVSIVTLAPEVEGANVLIAELLRRKIKVGIGHSLATYDEVMHTFDPDHMIVVHLLNAMDPVGSRQPGLAGAALANDAFALSLIADGVHIHPAVVKIIWRAKCDKSKVICISDGSAVTGLPDGRHQIGARTVDKQANRAALPNGTLAGSVVTLNVAVRNLMDFTGCTLSEAIATVSLNPATFLGRQCEVGQLKPGCKADMLIIDSRINIHTTFLAGEVVWRRDQIENP